MVKYPSTRPAYLRTTTVGGELKSPKSTLMPMASMKMITAGGKQPRAKLPSMKPACSRTITAGGELKSPKSISKPTACSPTSMEPGT